MVALRGNELIRFHSASPGTILGTATHHRPAARRAARRHRHAPGRRPALWRRQHQPALPVEPDHRRGDRRSVPSSRRCCPARASAWTSTRWSIACASSATPSRTSASTRTTAPSPASTRRSIRPATVTGVAYSNNVDGAATTLLYDIDAATDQLLRQGNPSANTGALIAVGPLGVNTSIDVAFDISPLDNTAFAALNVGGVSGLYTINLVDRRGHADRHDRHRHGDQRPDGDAAGLSVRRRRRRAPSSTPTCCSPTRPPRRCR